MSQPFPCTTTVRHPRPLAKSALVPTVPRLQDAPADSLSFLLPLTTLSSRPPTTPVPPVPPSARFPRPPVVTHLSAVLQVSSPQVAYAVYLVFHRHPSHVFLPASPFPISSAEFPADSSIPPPPSSLHHQSRVVPLSPPLRQRTFPPIVPLRRSSRALQRPSEPPLCCRPLGGLVGHDQSQPRHSHQFHHHGPVTGLTPRTPPTLPAVPSPPPYYDQPSGMSASDQPPIQLQRYRHRPLPPCHA